MCFDGQWTREGLHSTLGANFHPRWAAGVDVNRVFNAPIMSTLQGMLNRPQQVMTRLYAYLTLPSRMLHSLALVVDAT